MFSILPGGGFPSTRLSRGVFMKLHRSLKTRKARMYVFMFITLVPAFTIYTALILFPLLQGIAISFFDWRGLSATRVFVGIKHYEELFQDIASPSGNVIPAILHDLYLTIWRVIPIVLISLMFAEVLTRMRIRERGFYKVIFFFPNVLSTVVIALLWTFIYNPQFGLLTSGLNAIGLGSVVKPWLGDFGTALPSLVPPAVWSAMGFYLVIFITAIKGVPVLLYESATIDGASHFRQFFSITIPLIWEHIRIVVILLLVQSFATNFTFVQVMTNGGPAGATNVLIKELYTKAFENRNFGYGATLGVVATVMALFYSLIGNKLMKRESIEY
jgi:N-acetylglucosamine transport system permease protein